MNPIYRNLEKPKKRIILSILICTVVQRDVKPLVQKLLDQAQLRNVQILWLGDNRSMTVGAKRNKLISIADGEYVCFIDDDDLPLDGYLDEILKAIETGKSPICFWLHKTMEGKEKEPYRFSRDYTGVHQTIKQGNKIFKGYLPGHLCVWRKDQIKVPFPDISISEDHRWAMEMTKHYDKREEMVIEKLLYWYRCSDKTTLTRKRR